VQALLSAGAPVGAFSYDGLWLDIGRQDDYEQAVALWESEELGSLFDGQSTNGQSRSGSSAQARSEA
jgi:NDP-sugar pyrophosphorylase family protein